MKVKCSGEFDIEIKYDGLTVLHHKLDSRLSYAVRKTLQFPPGYIVVGNKPFEIVYDN